MSSRYNQTKSRTSALDGTGFGVPLEVSYRSKPSPVGGSVISSYISSSSSTVIGSGDTLRFEASSRDFLPGSSMFILWTVQTRSTTISEGGFDNFYFSSYLIRRLQTEVGSTMMDSINHYGNLYGALAKVSMNSDYLTHDGTFEGKNRKIPNNPAGDWGPGVDMCAPLLGLFSSDQAVPLLMSNSSVVITLEFVNPNTVKDTAGFDYRLVNPRLFITRKDMGELYNQEFRLQLAAAQMLTIPYVTFSGHSFGIAAATSPQTFTEVIQENCSSLLGLIIAIKSNATTSGRNLGERYYNGQFSSLEVRCDNILTPTYTISGFVHAWAEGQKLFSELWDVQSSGSVTAAQFGSLNADGAYAVANEGNSVFCVDFKRFSDNSFQNLGIPCRNGIEITMNGCALSNGDAGTVYVWLVKQHNMVLMSNGQVGMTK